MSTLQFNRETHHEVVVGNSGTGKTQKAIELIREYKGRVFIFDHQDGEFALRIGSQSFDSIDEVEKATDSGDKIICYNPLLDFDDLDEAFDSMCDWLMAVVPDSGDSWLLVVDEFSAISLSATKNPSFTPAFRNVVLRGRRSGLDYLLVCHSMNDLHNKVRNSVTKAHIFTHTDSTAAEWIAGRGVSLEKITALEKLQCLTVDLKTGEEKLHKIKF